MAQSSPTDMSQVLARVLAQVAQRTGSGTALSAVWLQVVGAVIASHCKPRSLQQGTLTVSCDALQWKIELEGRSADLLGQLRDRLGPNTVTRLSFECP